MFTASLTELEGRIGTELGVSEWVPIDQRRIDLFAEATDDYQWIHTDKERATRELPTGKTIAHGYLTLSLIPHLTAGNLKLAGATHAINYGCNKVRFTQMVPVGSRVRARQKLIDVRPRGGGVQVTTEVTIEIEGETRPACVAETMTLIFSDGAGG